MIASDFAIFSLKFQHLMDCEVDLFIKSFKYEYQSDERKILQLEQKILHKEAIKYLNLAVKELNG